MDLFKNINDRGENENLTEKYEPQSISGISDLLYFSGLFKIVVSLTYFVNCLSAFYLTLYYSNVYQIIPDFIDQSLRHPVYQTYQYCTYGE